MRITGLQRMLALVFILISCQTVFPQQPDLINSTKIDSLRYQDIVGSPYLYKSWQEAKITHRDGTIYDDLKLNFNGYEQTFEIGGSGFAARLNVDHFQKIDVLSKNGKTTQEWFIRGVHFEVALRLSNIIYKSDKIILIREFKVRITESTNEIYGDLTVKKKFVRARHYSILWNSKLIPITLNKNKLGQVFGNQELIYTTIKKHKLRLSKEKDLIELLVLIEDELD